jgi:hypothetical protein
MVALGRAGGSHPPDAARFCLSSQRLFMPFGEH